MFVKMEDLMLLPFPSQLYLDGNIDVCENDLAPEGYAINSDGENVEITAGDLAGYFYAEQTLQQLRRQYNDELPIMAIIDEPRFSWRGLHLDVSRHFFSVNTIKKLLAAMAHFKLNRFHWHLNDDQGWRLPIDKYPLLTEKGGWRIDENGNKYGGCYTKAEINEIVCFAQSLHIEVIPEIELPGHAGAALAAYPQFSCSGEKAKVEVEWGVFSDVYCTGKDETVEFLKDILAEVCEMFPSRWLHIGGDECPVDNWKKCPQCQKRMIDENLPDEAALQGWLMNQMAEFLAKKGKIPFGWDEIMDSSVKSEIGVMIWRGDGKDAQKMALNADQKMVMCPNFYCYFDWKQTAAEGEHGSFGVTTLSKTYSYEPAETPEMEKLVLGLQGNIWTERIVNEKELFYMAFPRALAIAESGWNARKSDFNTFLKRVKGQQRFLEFLEITGCAKME